MKQKNNRQLKKQSGFFEKIKQKIDIPLTS